MAKYLPPKTAKYLPQYIQSWAHKDRPWRLIWCPVSLWLSRAGCSIDRATTYLIYDSKNLVGLWFVSLRPTWERDRLVKNYKSLSVWLNTIPYFFLSKDDDWQQQLGLRVQLCLFEHLHKSFWEWSASHKFHVKRARFPKVLSSNRQAGQTYSYDM